VGSEEYNYNPFLILSLRTYNAGLAFMILFIAYYMSGLTPGNQLPYAECRLYARSIAMSVPVGDG